MGRNSLCPLEVKRWNKNKWERHPASWISQQRNKDKFLLLSSDMCCLFLFYYRTYIWDKYIQGVFSCAKFWKSANIRLSGRLAVMNVNVGLFTLWFLSEITTAVTSKLTDSNIRMVMSKLRWLVDNRHCTMLELLVTGESWISMFSTLVSHDTWILSKGRGRNTDIHKILRTEMMEKTSRNITTKFYHVDHLFCNQRRDRFVYFSEQSCTHDKIYYLPQQWMF